MTTIHQVRAVEEHGGVRGDSREGRVDLGVLVDDRSDEGIFRLRNEVFTDPAVFDLERERIFRGAWLYVGHISELAEPGNYVTRSVGGFPVIFVRDRAGSIHVLFNTCAHQGTQVCRAARGKASAFQCFFHGWTYSTDGRVVSRPGEESYGGSFAFEDRGLAVPHVEVYRGFVFMCVDHEAKPLVQYLGKAAERIDLVVDQAENMVIVQPSQKYLTRANWKMIAMNGIDGYHVATTHTTYLQYLRSLGAGAPDKRREQGGRVDLGNGHVAADFVMGWGRPVARWADYLGSNMKRHIAERKGYLVGRFGEDRAHEIAEIDKSLFVFPNLIIQDHSAITVRTWEPVSPGESLVSSWMLAPGEEAAEERAWRMKNYLTFFGPAGFATPDDIEALETAQCSLRTDGTYDISKGCMRDRESPTRGENLDEFQLRTVWRQWRTQMAGRPIPDEIAALPASHNASS